MKFIFKEEQNKKLVFGDVVENQFFVSHHGFLCQKVCNDTYHVIADEKGLPLGIQFNNISGNKSIQRILPEVLKIEF